MTSTGTHPTDTAPVVRWGKDGPELVQMRWGWAPKSDGEPIINVRAETAKLSRNRCLVPATELELFTGATNPKRRWTVTVKGEQIFFFAGLWREATEEWPECYAVITIDAAADLSPLTDRQPAVIRPPDAGSWLTGETDPLGLLKPLPSGSYEVEG
jgi:putative SOS response-associated peptidase YedK